MGSNCQKNKKFECKERPLKLGKSIRNSKRIRKHNDQQPPDVGNEVVLDSIPRAKYHDGMYAVVFGFGRSLQCLFTRGTLKNKKQ